VRYPEAEHGFNCDARAAYHAESATAAWTRMLAWLAENVR
jgi:carboxymethylenebutenolidase